MENTMEAGTLEAPAAEAAPEAGAEAPAAGGAAPAAGAGRTFTEAEVAKIVSGRVNELNGKWAKYGKPEELDARLTRAQQIEAWGEQMRSQFTGRKDLPGNAGGTAPLSDEDKKVQAYLERIYPGLKEQQERMASFETQAQQLHQFRWQSISDNNRKSLSELASKAGYTPEQTLQSDPNTPCIEKYVADSIRGNKADYEAYMRTGDQRIVAKHFEAVDKWVKGFSPKPPAAPAPQAAAAAAGKKVAGLPPRMPQGGVGAPTSGTRKLSDKERIDAAFAAHSKS